MLEEPSIERRYWFNVTVFDEDKTSDLMIELNNVGMLWDGNIEQHYVHKDYYHSYAEALEVIKRFKEVLRSHNIQDVDAWVECKTQPVCLNCGKLGRFSDFDCSSCGTELLDSVYVGE